MPAASATRHRFVCPPPLSVTVAAREGGQGKGSIAAGDVDSEVLLYLQQCPRLRKMYTECVENNFEPNCCISSKEAKLRMKRENVGYVDPDKPPKCRSLNSDNNLRPIESQRLQHFGKALRRQK